LSGGFLPHTTENKSFSKQFYKKGIKQTDKQKKEKKRKERQLFCFHVLSSHSGRKIGEIK
jgi:hypothetical protein